MTIQVKHCRIADSEHTKSERQYCHVFHRKDTICCAADFWDLPEQNRLGLLLHETGHLLMQGKKTHSEHEANQAVERASGIRIYYRDGTGGPDLEWICPEDRAKAKKFLGLEER